MSNFQLDSTLEAIFGERPEITTKRAQQRAAYELAEADETEFFRKAEIDYITGRHSSSEPWTDQLREQLGIGPEPQTFTKTLTAVDRNGRSMPVSVSVAKEKFVAAVDRFISQARGEVPMKTQKIL